MSGRIGLVAALPAEGAALFGPRKTEWFGGRKIVRISLSNDTELLGTVSGLGRENARSATRWLVENGCGIVVGAGVAGGLKPGMKPGDLVLPEEILEDAGGDVQKWPTNSPAQGRLSLLLGRAGIQVYGGKLFSSPVAILSPGEKLSLHRKTAALAVDMESAGIACAARESGVPFLIFRAICDPADRTVPVELSSAIAQNGAVRVPTLLGHLARKPTLIIEILHLRRDFAAALTHLRKGWQTLMKNDALSAWPEWGAMDSAS
jgi:adenosylhomocysteine nucleosidase